MKKNIFILVIAITLCGISFALGNSLNKSNKQEDMNKENKKEKDTLHERGYGCCFGWVTDRKNIFFFRTFLDIEWEDES